MLELAKTNPVELAKQSGKELLEFLKQNPNTFHYYEANELAGDLLVWLGNVENDPERFAAATTFYEKLAASPWPDFQARAQLLRARQLQLQAKYDEALKAYDAVLAVEAKGRLAQDQALEAKIGRTYCLAGTGRAQDAVKILLDTIAKADDDNTQLLARAYCALGNCYRALKDNQQARMGVFARRCAVSNRVGTARRGAGESGGAVERVQKARPRPRSEGLSGEPLPLQPLEQTHDSAVSIAHNFSPRSMTGG